MLKYGSAMFWRLGTRATVRNYTIPSPTVIKVEKVDVQSGPTDKPITTPSKSTENEKIGLVATVFANLNDPSYTPPENKQSPKSVKLSVSQKVDLQIKQANDVNSVLSVAEAPVISRRHALKIVSILSEWSNMNKVTLADFEQDPRFLRLCRILARTSNTHTMTLMTRPDDLNTVLGITGDDEAARLISNLTLPQMVKVMQALAQKSRRSTPLLRSLANNIMDITAPIDLKKAADLLYCMVSLNFPDPVLMDRICNDIIQQLPSNTSKASVVTSIVTSLGLMKYRHEPVLDAITSWMVDNMSVCRPQDIASAVVTLGTLNYVPQQSTDLLENASRITESDLLKTSCWLDLVFSLLILQNVRRDQLISSLKSEFFERMLTGGDIPINVRRKLMVIDAYLTLTEANYDGPRLPEDLSLGVSVVYTKEKQLYVQSIMDTFKNFISSGTFLKKNCNSGMGFLYDGEFVVDAKCHPVPLSQAGQHDKSIFHIAVLGLDYHDMSRKTVLPLGIYQLYTRLLELKGFKVLQIPYSEFNPRDKLLVRVQYIEKRLKTIVDSKPAS